MGTTQLSGRLEMQVQRDMANSDGIYVLSPEEEKMIDEADAELEAGLGIPAEVFLKEAANAWRVWYNVNFKNSR